MNINDFKLSERADGKGYAEQREGAEAERRQKKRRREAVNRRAAENNETMRRMMRHKK